MMEAPFTFDGSRHEIHRWRRRLRLTVDGTRIANEERIAMKRRIRDVIEAPDGAVLVLVDAKSGELLRLTPVAARPAAAPVRRR